VAASAYVNNVWGQDAMGASTGCLCSAMLVAGPETVELQSVRSGLLQQGAVVNLGAGSLLFSYICAM
jgi:hypothetical protein